MSIDSLASLLMHPAIGGDLQALLLDEPAVAENPELFLAQLSEQLQKLGVDSAQEVGVDVFGGIVQEVENSASVESTAIGSILPVVAISDPVRQLDSLPEEMESQSLVPRVIVKTQETDAGGIVAGEEEYDVANSSTRFSPKFGAEEGLPSHRIMNTPVASFPDTKTVELNQNLANNPPDVDRVAEFVPLASTPKQTVVAVERPVGQAGWGQELGNRIVWMTGKEVDSAQIRVNPPQLGPVEVRINLNQDQASVAFTAQNASVRDAIEAAVPKLREMLSSQQLNLVNVDISQQSFSNQQQQESWKERGYSEAQNHPSGLPISDEDVAEEIDSSQHSLSQGLLNYYV